MIDLDSWYDNRVKSTNVNFSKINLVTFPGSPNGSLEDDLVPISHDGKSDEPDGKCYGRNLSNGMYVNKGRNLYYIYRKIEEKGDTVTYEVGNVNSDSISMSPNDEDNILTLKANELYYVYHENDDTRFNRR